MQKILMLVKTSRPISWINTAYPFAAGYLMMGGDIDARLILGTAFFFIPYNLLMYGVNDVFDYESDIRNPRKGGVEGAVTAQSNHRLIIWVCLLLCMPFVIGLLILGSWLSNLTLIALLFFVVAYSAKYLRFKEIPVLDSLTSSIHFVGPLVYAYSLLGTSYIGWYVAAAFFLWGFASHAFGAVQDVIPDRQAGLRSIATIFGARVTVRIATLLYLAASGMCILLGGYGTIIGIAGLSYVLTIIPFWFITDKDSDKANIGWKKFLLINYSVGALITICLILIIK